MIANSTLPAEPAVQVPLPKGGTGRFETYTAIHKGLRLLMAETLAAVGRTDAANEAEVASTLRLVRELTTMCRLHLHSENQFVHAAMEARCPGSSSLAAQEHADHEASIERLEADVLAAEKCQSESRASLLFTLYGRLAVFMADNLEHMREEETHNQDVLWQTHTDDELRALEHAIVASHSPSETALAVRWMVPALPQPERTQFVAALRGALPDHAFQGLATLVLARTGARGDARLVEALGAH